MSEFVGDNREGKSLIRSMERDLAARCPTCHRRVPEAERVAYHGRCEECWVEANGRGRRTTNADRATS